MPATHGLLSVVASAPARNCLEGSALAFAAARICQSSQESQADIAQV